MEPTKGIPQAGAPNDAVPIVPVTEFVVERATWLRADKNSQLHRVTDGRQCCLGFYLRACGLPVSAIAGFGEPGEIEGVVCETAATCIRSVDDDLGEWHDCVGNTNLAEELMTVNDDMSTGDATKERLIAERFARAGVTVTFK